MTAHSSPARITTAAEHTCYHMTLSASISGPPKAHGHADASHASCIVPKPVDKVIQRLQYIHAILSWAVAIIASRKEDAGKQGEEEIMTI